MNSCEQCALFAFDEDAECFCCEASFDEDELARLNSTGECPYFRLDDEYGVVRHQN